jgi:hypothetical protein
MKHLACTMWRHNVRVGKSISMVTLMRNCVSDVTRALTAVVVGFTVSVAMAQGAGAHRVKAMLVSQESSLHTSVSNRDVYLLRVMPRSGVGFDATAVDSYPGYAEALPLHGLSKGVIISVKLIRTPYCDLPASEDGQRASTRCFAIERDTVRAPKNAADLWWK